MGSPAVRPQRLGRRVLRPSLVGLLGFACATLVACGSSGKGLIPAADAGPLQSDFEEIAQAAKTGNGDCTATREAIAKAEADFQKLPASVDSGLRARLRVGLTNLSSQARSACAEPLAGVTTATTPTTTSTSTTQSTTSSTSTSTSSTLSRPTTTLSTPSATTPPPGGGTPAPSESEGTPGNGNGEGNGAGPGGSGAGNGNGNGQGNGLGNGNGNGGSG
ncbi:MAG TPA: hypothetical protein VID70_03620 [Solirubrobacteraceae bacterium]|jgi:hypothetical protein